MTYPKIKHFHLLPRAMPLQVVTLGFKDLILKFKFKLLSTFIMVRLIPSFW